VRSQAEYIGAAGAEMAVRMFGWEVGVERTVWMIELGGNDGNSNEETGASMDSFGLFPASGTTV
jgi:hypothetical protein